MWELTYRTLMANKRRVTLTAVAVLLGVAFIGATTILGATVRESLTASAGNFYEQLAADVRGAEVEQTASRASIPADLQAKVEGVDGVTEVIPIILEPVTAVGSNGKVLAAPIVAGTWFDSTVQPLRIVEGKAPTESGELVLSEDASDDLGLGVGDTVSYESGVGPAEGVVTGIAEADSSSVAGVPSVAVAPADHEKLIAVDQVSQLAVVGTGVDVAEIRALATAEVSDIEVQSGADAAQQAIDDAEASATALTATFTAFGALSLFVGVFIIYNTFNILMAQRRRDMALLRAIGVRRGQVIRSVLVEAAAIGLIAGIGGAALGVAIAVLGRSLLLGDIDGALVVAPGGLVTGVLIGLVTTVASAWIPARRAARVAPVEALREASLGGSGLSKVRIAIGVVLAVVTAFLLVSGLAPDAEDAAITIGVSAFVGLLAMIVLSPLLTRLLVPVFGAPVRLLRGQVGNLATENARRQPQRTAATASALILGVAIIGFALVVAASIKASVSTAIADRVSAEYIVAPVSFGTPLSPAAVEAAEEAAGDVPTSLAWGVPAAVEGSDQLMFALDTRTGSALWDFQPEGGSVEDLGSDGILVDRHVADDEGWTIGDRVEVAFIAGETRTYTIEATGDTRPFGSDYLIDSTDISTIAPASMSMQLLIGEGASREGIEAALADFPNAEVTSPSELADELNSIVNLLLQVLFGFLGLSVIIAFIGVANTLALSIFERTRELGILRAIALRRSHVRSAVRWEAAIISGLGTALGIAFGAGFGVALSKVLENTGFTRVTVPWGQLALVVVVASAAGALAAALPARRAAKLDILEAIHQL